MEQTDDCYPCLICRTLLVIPGKSNKFETRNKNSKPQISTKEEPNETLEAVKTNEVILPHLRTFYFLKEMINYPMSEITLLFTKLGSPADWFKLCQSCIKLIEESMKMKRKANLLLQQINLLNDHIRAQVIESESFALVPSTEDVTSNVQLHIRRYVASNEFPVETRKIKSLDKAYPSDVDEDFSVDYPTSDDDDNTVKPSTPIQSESESYRRSKRNVKKVPKLQLKPHSSGEEDNQETMESEVEISDIVDDKVERKSNSNKDDNPLPQAKTPQSDKKGPRKNLKRRKDNDWSPNKKYKAKPRIRPRKNPKDTIRCIVCSTFVDDATLDSHLATHLTDPSYIYPCPNKKCKFSSISPYHLKSHMRQATYKCLRAAKLPLEHPKLICSTCSFSTQRINTFRVHLHRHETGSKTISCPVTPCPVQFTTRQSVEFHLLDHITKRAVSHQNCLLCKQNVLLSDISTHLQFEHEITKPVNCQQCPQWFPSDADLINHMIRHMNEGMYCHMCGPAFGKFVRMDPLREHYFSQHSIGRKFECSKCTKMFYREGTFKNHKCSEPTATSAELVIKPKRFVCDLCSDSWTTEDCLVAHNIKKHGADPFVCSHCSETFSHRDKWIKHEGTHGGVVMRPFKRYKCDKCDMAYKTPVNLRRHIKATHAEQKEFDFVCDACGKGYRNPQSLKIHQESAHDKVRYPCPTCGREFVSKLGVQRHLIIHTGEKPFSCEVCGQLFRHKQSLDAHVKQHYKLGDKFKPHGPMKERPMFKKD